MSNGRRAFIDPILERAYQRLGLDGDNATTLGTAAHAEVERLAQAGDGTAHETLRSFARERFVAESAAWLKRDVGTITISPTGKVVSLPTRFAVATRAMRRMAAKGLQRPLWWTLSWDEFEALIASLASQAGRLSEEVAALREVQRLRLVYPQANTVGDACRQAGINPRVYARKVV